MGKVSSGYCNLKKGEYIGFFSPSTPITCFCPKRFNRGKEFLKSKGFQLKEGKLTGKNDFYRSGSIKERAEELNELIRDPEVRCIMSTIGGMNSNSILPYIDYEALKKDPKVIIGYSDVTALLLGIYAKTGISTYYGPALVASFGELGYFVDTTYDYFNDIVIGDMQLPYKIECPQFWTDEFIDWETQTGEKEKRANSWKSIVKGRATGRLMGGNLNTMMGIWGSEYMPEIKKGDILLIEDCMKDASTIERAFSLLKLNGVFDRVAGIILGKHEQFNDRGTGRKPFEILMEVIGDTHIPILADFDCCHTHPMIPLPIGAVVSIDTIECKVEILK